MARTADIAEGEIVHRFVGRVSQEKATPLLAVARLTHLERGDRPGRNELREDELRMLRATEYPEDAGSATPPSSVGTA
jgi:hypothetical protein